MAGPIILGRIIGKINDGGITTGGTYAGGSIGRTTDGGIIGVLGSIGVAGIIVTGGLTGVFGSIGVVGILVAGGVTTGGVAEVSVFSSPSPQAASMIEKIPILNAFSGNIIVVFKETPSFL